MQVLKTLSPGANGTKRYASEYGDKLICVRYRKDPIKKRRLTTVELIVEEKEFPLLKDTPHAAKYPDTLVQVSIAYNETNLRLKAKQAGAKWLPRLKLWEMPYRCAKALGLEERIEHEELPF